MRMNWLTRVPLELIFWVTGFLLLGLAKPAAHDYRHHFTCCPLANLGLSWCPGCGLGRSVTHLLHGNIREGLHYHWFGIPAVLIIGHRMVTLGKYEWKRLKN